MSRRRCDDRASNAALSLRVELEACAATAREWTRQNNISAGGAPVPGQPVQPTPGAVAPPMPGSWGDNPAPQDPGGTVPRPWSKALAQIRKEEADARSRGGALADDWALHEQVKYFPQYGGSGGGFGVGEWEGVRYAGFWKKGKPHGYGAILGWGADGRYEGQWQDGKRSGRGVEYGFESWEVTTYGEYENGILANGWLSPFVDGGSRATRIDNGSVMHDTAKVPPTMEAFLMWRNKVRGIIVSAGMAAAQPEQTPPQIPPQF